MVEKKSSLAKRYEASYNASKGNGGNFNRVSAMNFKKVGREVKFYQAQEGKNRINIVPYTVKTENHPQVKKGVLKKGDLDYGLEIWTHRSVGPTEATVICNKNTYGKPCPVCELANKLRAEGKEKEANQLKPSHRVLYNVQDLKEPENLKVFEVSHFLFEKELIEACQDEGFIDFADIEEGKEVRFKCSKVSRGGFEFNEFKNFNFDDREEPLTDEVVEQAISLDDCMNVMTYEQVENILYGRDEDEVREVRHDDDYEEEVPQKETRQEKKAEVETSYTCPHGKRFGIDTDDYDCCDDCDIWDKCMKVPKH